MKINSNRNLKSIVIKMTALLAFLVINFIGYRAFSQELKSEAVAVTPACQIAQEGYVANQWKNIRIQVGDAFIAGAQSLKDLGVQLRHLVVEHKCLPIPVPCSFSTEGLALGSWVKHRIMVKDKVAFGSNTTAQLFAQLGELKKIGICE